MSTLKIFDSEKPRKNPDTGPYPRLSPIQLSYYFMDVVVVALDALLDY